MKKVLSLLMLLPVAISVVAKNCVVKTADGFAVSIENCVEDIFRIKITPGSEFPESLMERYGLIKTDWPEINAKVTETDQIATIENNRFILTVDKEVFSIKVQDKEGRIVVKPISYLPPQDCRIKQMGDMLDKRYEWCKAQTMIAGTEQEAPEAHTVNDVGDVSRNSMLGFELDPDELFYGGGNASHEHLQHRGEILRMWTRFSYSGMAVPYIMSNRGWAVYSNSTVRSYFDIGVTDKDKMWIYNTQPTFDFYLFLGDDMLDALDLYTQVTGRSMLLPNWAYGASFAGIEIENMMEIMYDAVRFRDEKIPMDLIWVEPQWMQKKYDYSTKKEWNYGHVFAVPKFDAQKRGEYNNLLTGRLHDMGYKVALWLCIDTDHSIDEEDDIAARTGGKLSGQEHWFDHLMRFVDQGVDGFKLDPGETQQEHVTRLYYNGRTDSEMHTVNQVIMPKRMLKTFREHTGRRSYHHFCGAWAGTQHWTAQTSGDIGGGLKALYDQVNLSCSGFINTSCDALSFDYMTEMQALHFDALLPWMEVNGWMSLLQPWFMSEHDKAMFIDYLRLRNTLYPYIYSAAVRGALTSRPAMMAMPLAFPDDRNVEDMADEYMLGDNLLVGVFSDSVYLPGGKWIYYWTGEEFEGDGRVRKISIPDNRGGHLFIRKGAIIPYQRQMQYIGQYPLDTLQLHVYPCGESSYTLYEDDGRTYQYENGEVAMTRFDCVQDGGKVRFKVNPVKGGYNGMYESRTYELTFHGITNPSSVRVDGVKVKGWNFCDGVLSLTVHQSDTTESLSVDVR